MIVVFDRSDRQVSNDSCFWLVVSWLQSWNIDIPLSEKKSSYSSTLWKLSLLIAIWFRFKKNTWIWASAWDFQQCGLCDQQRLRSARAYAQSDQILCLSLEYSMTVKLLTEDYLESLSLKGGCTGSSETTLVKMPHCWRSQVVAHIKIFLIYQGFRTEVSYVLCKVELSS